MHEGEKVAAADRAAGPGLDDSPVWKTLLAEYVVHSLAACERTNEPKESTAAEQIEHTLVVGW